MSYSWPVLDTRFQITKKNYSQLQLLTDLNYSYGRHYKWRVCLMTIAVDDDRRIVACSFLQKCSHYSPQLNWTEHSRIPDLLHMTKICRSRFCSLQFSSVCLDEMRWNEISDVNDPLGLGLYTISQKNKTLYICPYLRQMLTDFNNSFTCRLSGRCATKWFLNIKPHIKLIATLPCDLSLITIHVSDCRYLDLNTELTWSPSCLNDNIGLLQSFI